MYLPVSENVIDFEYLKENMAKRPWNFGSDDDMKFLKEINSRPKKVSDIVTVQNGIVTNRDYIYIIQAYTDKELTKPYAGKGETVYFKDKSGKVHEIESAILRRCVKASRYEGKTDNTYIIFPYAEAPISEDRLKKNFQKHMLTLIHTAMSWQSVTWIKTLIGFCLAGARAFKTVG